ncbi:IPT/TIG domain-containing protein [Robiginitalea sp. IMCC43444]|uniref:IPT/TIG domain-containing protein n=1 Tax=Robiginitalea sp. IMCC43444 TaxID=3459121 RepID=UPI00404180B7
MKGSLKLLKLFVLMIALTACSEDDMGEVVAFNVTSISPEVGTVGTELTITGSNFPSDAAKIELTIGGAVAPITSLTDSRIVTSVPPGAVSGEVRIVANGVAKTAPASFTVLQELEVATFENLFAPQEGGQGQGEIGGPFTKFSFETGAVTESNTDWDIAFRGTTIAINGGVATGTNDEPERNADAGAVIVNGLFDEINSAEGLSFSQDASGAFAIPLGSDNGWYNYNFMTNVVSPIPGVVLVFRTHDGKYAKVEILSYYKDAPANPDGFADASRYYTFRYVYNPNEGELTLAN